MVVIALTGGIGAGKSFASDCFRARGATVIDLDDLSRPLLDPATPTFDELVVAFGASVLDMHGRIDRAELARRAFESDEAAARLNAIMHPALTRATERILSELRGRPDALRFVVVEVPLLVEAPAFAKLADVVLAISANPDLRLKRSIAWGRGEADARARMARQASDAERAAIADHVIVNEGTREEFAAQIEAFADELVASHGT
jgi:dephospho-CoA kinase